MQKLHPRVIWLFFINSMLRWLSLFIFGGVYLVFFYFGSYVSSDNTAVNYLANLAVLVYIGAILFIVILSYVWARLSYHFYRYELTDNGFKKESGVIYKQYVTIPYERIQNVDIYRGVIARILGLSDIHVQTAGSTVAAGKYGKVSEGRLPGLAFQDAEKLQDELIKRAKGSKSGV